MKVLHRNFKLFLMGFFVLMAAMPVFAENVGVHQFEMNLIEGDKVSLSEYKNKVVLIVNVASKCGFTNQYQGLQTIYEKYKDKDFVVLGFPSNDFMGQEPGTNVEIQNFCQLNYGVTFPMFEKIKVKGKDMHPLYSYLTSSDDHPKHTGKISWNFNKFLIDKEGRVVNRFGSRVKPESKELVQALESLL